MKSISYKRLLIVVAITLLFQGCTSDYYSTNNATQDQIEDNLKMNTRSITKFIDSEDVPDFNIFFASPEDFEELSDDREFISRSGTKIALIDSSGGNGSTAYLTFEKNELNGTDKVPKDI